jgi:hypothetical protein
MNLESVASKSLNRHQITGHHFHIHKLIPRDGTPWNQPIFFVAVPIVLSC